MLIFILRKRLFQLLIYGGSKESYSVCYTLTARTQEIAQAETWLTRLYVLLTKQRNGTLQGRKIDVITISASIKEAYAEMRVCLLPGPLLEQPASILHQAACFTCSVLFGAGQ